MILWERKACSWEGHEKDFWVSSEFCIQTSMLASNYLLCNKWVDSVAYFVYSWYCFSSYLCAHMKEEEGRREE